MVIDEELIRNAVLIAIGMLLGLFAMIVLIATVEIQSVRCDCHSTIEKTNRLPVGGEGQ